MRKRNGPKAVPMPALSRENTPPNLNLHELQDIPATLILSEESPKKAVLRAPGTPWDEKQVTLELDGEVTSKQRKSLQARRRYYFIFGGLLGAIAVYLSLMHSEAAWPNLPILPEFDTKFMESIALPAGFGKDFRETIANLTESFGGVGGKRGWMETTDFKVGREALKDGLEKKHAVVLIPGIISSGLESWATDDQTSNFFRKRVWGTTTMVRAILTNKQQWIQTLSLDLESGLDPPNVKVRSAQGFDSASYFITGYFIWAKIIEDLAVLGYDPSDMALSAYDWRLTPYNLQVRDKYFSKLKYQIEHYLTSSGKKTVLISHSMGAQIVMWFLKWVEAPGFGDGGPKWVETHIESFVNIAGTLLGVPKASAALLSGEMRDTVELNPAGVYLLEKFFSRQERAQLFRSWGGAAQMWPKGGDAVWGDEHGAPDDPEGAGISGGAMYRFKAADVTELNSTTVTPNLTMNDALTYMLQHTPDTFQRMMESNYSHGIERDAKQIAKNDLDHRKWSNPLEVRLPNAPSMKIYCLYGWGKATERSYFYAKGEYTHGSAASADLQRTQCSADDLECNEDQGVTDRQPLDMPMSRKSWIDTSITLQEGNSSIRSGVLSGEGDGTVSVLSHGVMCAEGGGWSRPLYNPAGIKIVTKELMHEPAGIDLRGGPATADHVDVLGNSELSRSILRVVSGVENPVESRYHSRIREMVKKVKW